MYDCLLLTLKRNSILYKKIDIHLLHLHTNGSQKLLLIGFRDLQTSQSIQLQKLFPDNRLRKKKDEYIVLKPSDLQVIDKQLLYHIKHIYIVSSNVSTPNNI